jgi:hypothetical protein
LGSLPPFVLTTPDGARFDNASLGGRVWLLGFVETGCVACGERLGAAMEQLQYRIRNVGPAVGLLEVAVPSPVPLVNLAEDMSRRHANPRQWRIATGPDAQRLLANVGALALSRGAMLEAGGAVALVDEKGRVRAVESVQSAASLNLLVSELTLILNIR